MADKTSRRGIGASAGAHAEHDLLLIAAFAAADVEPADAAAAERLLASCPDCAALAADLRSIARATAELPPVTRPRDFTLRPADAARLRPLGWRRLAAAFGARRLDVTRPLAAGLMTLGLAGLLFASLPAIGSSSGTAGSAPAAAGSPGAAAQGAPANADSLASAAALPAPSAMASASRAAASAQNLAPIFGAAGSGEVAGPVGSSPDKAPPADTAGRTAVPTGPEAVDTVDRAAIGAASGVVLAAGVALLALSRRRREIPS